MDMYITSDLYIYFKKTQSFIVSLNQIQFFA